LKRAAIAVEARKCDGNLIGKVLSVPGVRFPGV